MPNPALIFASYAREDAARVRPLLEAVGAELQARRIPARLWVDTEDLKPGELWDAAITRALEASIGLLVFVSQQSSRSDWVRREVAVAGAQDKLVIPIVLDDAVNLPMMLARRQYVRHVGDVGPGETRAAAARVCDAIAHFLRQTPDPLPTIAPREAPVIAADIARDVRASASGGSRKPSGHVPNSVFLVHGHDDQALAEIEGHLHALSVDAIVLARQSESAQSLFQKFLSIAGQAGFAIVLLSADDRGASRLQYDEPGVADRALQYRARQNVILELGFFYGHLGFERVFVVAAKPPTKFPNFERPSDLDGVVFESMTDPGWKVKLARRLRQAGFAVQEP
jgi:predicted nucleotide-binding protein